MLWEGIVLLIFRILNTCPCDIAIKYGAYYQTRANYLEDLEKTKVKRSSWEGNEKTQKTWLCSLQEPWTTPKDSRWEHFYMKNSVTRFFSQLRIFKDLVLQNTELYRDTRATDNKMSKLKPMKTRRKKTFFPRILIIESEILESRNKIVVFPFPRVLRKLLVCWLLAAEWLEWPVLYSYWIKGELIFH